MATTVKNNFLAPSLVSNLQQVLITRKNHEVEEDQSIPAIDSEKSPPPFSSDADADADAVESTHVVNDSSKPVVLVTNGDGIESPGLTCSSRLCYSKTATMFMSALLNQEFQYNTREKSVSGHSVTVQETISVCSAEICGATAFEVSGTPADCVSLALSGALFSWSKPVLVISGINRGSSCGQNMFYSGAVAGAREALICGVPSICISLNWKKDVSHQNYFKDAVNVSLPLINAAIGDIEKGTFPRNCLLNIEISSSPLRNKGFKVTRQSLLRSTLSWQVVSANRQPSSGYFMSNQQSIGIKLAQLSRDASAAGAVRRLNSHQKNVEIESVGLAGKFNSQQSVKKYFRLEFLDKEQEDIDRDLDFGALENGYVAVTPLSLLSEVQPEIQTFVSNWIAFALAW